MKKNAVFFGVQGQNALNRVYSSVLQDILANETNLLETVIDHGNLAEHAQALQQVECGFSTWGMPAFTTEEIRQYLPNLKIVFYAAGSVQNFARPFLHNGIKVVSAWVANGVPVAEYTVAQILLANKGFFQSMAMTKQNYLAARQHFETFPGNYNSRIGLLGAGIIGTKVVELLRPFKWEVLVFDPFLSNERAMELGVRKADLEEIFSSCQTISNHLANLPATVGILHQKHFNLLMKNATFINTGRGAQVVEQDLAEALSAVPTRTAVLDVTLTEPLELDSPLLQLDNVFLTPHMAGSSGNEVVRMAEYMIDEFTRYKKGEDLYYSVTLQMLEQMA